ncbi:carboxylating nicotinate-nucleotide diphosphorylase [Archaeoglobus veneficus]|uniref:Nicotinate-nucleotide pyrophosphorylase [carboxylating] n=1 Tax=Archaeoglobus veneficus (strain DSM 11195 / SNP6) TaxID=693661 RepID=F2KQ20_ARCVS|nr:carboxylating nicotinate-nucleotide diphosphorylase [Archaeoglobus veneficus]AEA47623.1 nicotinate-nucleotide pyrophosphorylase [Archaeoglobus veneficus SNP6]
MFTIPRFIIEEHVRRFLEEDLYLGDITPVPKEDVKAKIVAKQRGVVAGIEVAKIAFEIVGVEVIEALRDGEEVERGQTVMAVTGRAGDVLMAERTVLNILMRMSGIATTTRDIVEKAKKINPSIRVAATRKTTPGFRLFEKIAVVIGGGDPHRFNLGDCVLIKDNHITVSGGVGKAIRLAKAASFTKKIEIEVRTVDEAIAAAREGADIIMFDNMDADEIRKAVETLEQLGLRDKVILEASGGIRPENVEEYASTGVDVLSSGYIIHSAKPVDMSLYISSEDSG